MSPVRVLILTAVLFSFAARASDEEPAVFYTIDVAHPNRSPRYDDADVGRIIRLVRAVPHICHHVQEISFQSASKAEVRTGYRSPWDESSPDHGDMLYLQKTHSSWQVPKRARWKYAGHGGSFELVDQ